VIECRGFTRFITNLGFRCLCEHHSLQKYSDGFCYLGVSIYEKKVQLKNNRLNKEKIDSSLLPRTKINDTHARRNRM